MSRVACAGPAAHSPVPQQHVQDGRKENLEGFVRTFQKELPEDSHAGVFALDCEMVSLGSQEPGCCVWLGPLWEGEEGKPAESCHRCPISVAVLHYQASGLGAGQSSQPT